MNTGQREKLIRSHVIEHNHDPIVEDLCNICYLIRELDATREEPAQLRHELEQLRQKYDLTVIQRQAARAIVSKNLPELGKCKDVGSFAAICGVEFDEYQNLKLANRKLTKQLEQVAIRAEEAERELEEARRILGEQGRRMREQRVEDKQ